MKPSIKMKRQCHTYWGFERNASEPPTFRISLSYRRHQTNEFVRELLVFSLTKIGLVNKFRRFRLLLIDGFAFNVAAGNNLKNMYTNWIHITCYAHMIKRLSSKTFDTDWSEFFGETCKKCMKNVLVLNCGESFKNKKRKVGLFSHSLSYQMGYVVRCRLFHNSTLVILYTAFGEN